MQRFDKPMSHTMTTHQRHFPAGSFRWLALAAFVALFVVLLDVLTKELVIRELGPDGSRSSISIAGDLIELHYVRNSGVAFGLLSGSSTIAGVLVGVVIVPLIFVLALLAGRGPLWATAAGLVLGGAAGNVVDRLGDQMVTDFVSVGRWPSFNLADASITVGALLLIGLSFRSSGREDQPAGSP
jgi:signal peptidase II